MRPESLDNKVDVLNEQIPFKVDIDSSCAPDLPKIEEGDFETRMERGTFLIGKWTVGEVVDIKVEGVFDTPEFIIPDPKGGAIAFHFDEAMQAFESMKGEHSDASTLSIVGELHTHPHEEVDGFQKPWVYSDADKKAWIDMYQKSAIPPTQPYLCAIVTQNRSNKSPQLALYRVVKKESGEFDVVPMNDWNWS